MARSPEIGYLLSLLDDEDESIAVDAMAELLQREDELGDDLAELQESPNPLFRRRGHQLQAAITLRRRRREFIRKLRAPRVNLIDGLIDVHLQWYDNDSRPELESLWNDFRLDAARCPLHTLEELAYFMRKSGFAAQPETTLRPENYCLGPILENHTGSAALLAAIAAEAGVDDFLAEATPEGKLEKIREFQREGHLVAMTGDGTNDAPALAQADVAVAMNTGTQAAKEAGNMVDLDSRPTKLIEIVRIGKQLLMTRGSLTTFSVANDVAKYFAIIPALFSPIYPGLDALNILGLASPLSAVLSAIIYNALVIVALIPAALKGVKYREVPSGQLLTHNLLVWGLGGIVAPFVFIKLIDMLLAFCGIM